MKIVVCYKNIPSAEDISIRKDRSLDFSGASWEIGQYDMNAIEAAMAIASADEDSQVIAMTAAGKIIENSKLKKAVLSRGPQKMIGIEDEKLDTADAYAIAETLAAAIKMIGGVDVVLFGEGSGDVYAQQTGVLTGAILGWNTVNALQAVELNGDKLHVVRSGPDMFEELEISLPAVICVTGDINKPRIPTLKDIMAAGKKPVEIMGLDELCVSAESRVATVSILAQEKTERKQIVYEKALEENYAEIVQAIQNAR